MASEIPRQNQQKKGVDVLLHFHGQNLQVGQSCSFRLVKGPSTIKTADPVDKKAPHQVFPLIAKFPESVVRPDFVPQASLRLYQQDIPKPDLVDSDEEATEAAANARKKRWKFNRQHAVNRQWILQDQVEFLETMLEKRKKNSKHKNSLEDNASKQQKISSRYEGSPEHNSSHYVLVSVAPQHQQQPTLVIRLLPTPQGTVTFSQPYSRHTLSLSQAEQAIQDQRAGNPSSGAPALLRANHTKKTGNSKSRLLSKLSSKGGADEEEDDVMGDVTFRNRKGGGSAARRELLSSLGDGVAVSSEGVIGGTNDAQFGGSSRFGKLQVEQPENSKTAPNETTERGADGAAMADDFYQRDVQAEYDELDYDAKEQFDDDDVDMAETEVVVEGGFADDDFDVEDDEDDEDDRDGEEAQLSGAEGLASAAGFRAMLAKARGEVVPEDATSKLPAGGGSPGISASSSKDDTRDNTPDKKRKRDDTDGSGGGPLNHIAKIEAAAKESAARAQRASADKVATPNESEVKLDDGQQVDENGLRIITLEAIRREIWLNQKEIPMKRLMKLFDMKKTTPERQAAFRDAVKELCTMRKDPIHGSMLVLKQHYAKP